MTAFLAKVALGRSSKCELLLYDSPLVQVDDSMLENLAKNVHRHYGPMVPVPNPALPPAGKLHLIYTGRSSQGLPNLKYSLGFCSPHSVPNAGVVGGVILYLRRRADVPKKSLT